MTERYDEQYQALFGHLPKTQAPQGLALSVLERIESARLRIARLRVAIAGFFGVFAGLLFVPAITYTVEQMAQSGFVTYCALIFSDSETLVLYWKEFGITLLEALPAMGITMILLALLTLLGALRFITTHSHSISAHRFA